MPGPIRAPKARLAAALFALVCALTGFVLGDRYISRLPNHAGYFLVPVQDEVHVPIPNRPRHTIVIVVDGLRLDAAQTMTSARTLRSAGQCRVSDQGTYTVSRPVYSLLSTGLEVDRAGSRNNEQTAPLAAESVWQIARQSGLRVVGHSHLPWFQQLFPEGFDRFTVAQSHADNVFDVGVAPYAETGLADIHLIHPLYVDEAGHLHGAASREYADAVKRADGEINALLKRVDLTRDIVILTADHGHRDRGGHGGAQPEIRNVLVCFAGPTIAKRGDDVDRGATFDGRSTGPLLALLLGLRFPRHMRAGDDGLDVLFEIVRSDETNAAYLADRRAAIAKFRDENRIALEQWLGDAPGTWPRLYARGERAQTIRIVIVAIFTMTIFAVLFFIRRRSDGGTSTTKSVAATSAGFTAFTLLAMWGVHHVILGDFDYTVINLRVQFLPRAFGTVLLSALVSMGMYMAFVGRHQATSKIRDLAPHVLNVTLLLLIANVGHIFVYGWPLGFPLPPAAARYFPFFGAISLVVYGMLTLVFVLLAKPKKSVSE